jgi:hypothetical protein
MNAAASSVQQTSLFTYRNEVLPTLSERQQAVLAELRQRENMTNSELAVALGWQINRVTPRTNELVKAGQVVEACRRYCRVTGRTCIAWKIKSKEVAHSVLCDVTT